LLLAARLIPESSNCVYIIIVCGKQFSHVLDVSYIMICCLSFRSDPALRDAFDFASTNRICRLHASHAKESLVQRLRCTHLWSFNAVGVWRYNIKVDDYRYSYFLCNKISTAVNLPSRYKIERFVDHIVDFQVTKWNKITDVEKK